LEGREAAPASPRRRRGLQHYTKAGHLPGPPPCRMAATTRQDKRIELG
jgi:hypothetical protein